MGIVCLIWEGRGDSRYGKVDGCFVVINPCVVSANRVDFGLFNVSKVSNFTPPPPPQVNPASRLVISALVGPSATELSASLAKLRTHNISVQWLVGYILDWLVLY